MTNDSNDIYRKEIKKKWGVLTVLIALLVSASFYALNVGSISLSPSDVIAVLFSFQDISSQAKLVIMDIRLPRVLLAIITGASLAVAGTVMQALMRNPLVSPFTLGLSSAAAFGAACAIILNAIPFLTFLSTGSQDLIIVLAAFIFGTGSMLLIYIISRKKGSTSATLILAGVVIGYIFQAGLLLLQYLSNNEKLRQITLWLMGGMWGANWSAVIIVTPIALLCIIYLHRKAWDLNALLAGDEIAKNVGVEIKKVRLRGLLISTMAASVCLAFTGIIGFIGLIGPHVGRMLIGNDNRYLIPCGALLGAVILLISDTIARTIIEPVEIPVGVIMYLLGGFFFLYLILGRKHQILT